MFTQMLMGRLPCPGDFKSLVASKLSIRPCFTRGGSQKVKKISPKKRGFYKRACFPSFSSSSFKSRTCSKMLTMGLNNDVNGMICMLHEHIENDTAPKFADFRLTVNSLCDAQSKEGIVLASLIAHQHFPHHYKCLNSFKVFEPVHWNPITLDQSISHFVSMYSKSAPAFVGRSFRSSILMSYFTQGFRSEFLDLHYFVHDVYYYWKDPLPLTAFWEILYSSSREEDHAHADSLLLSSRHKIVEGMERSLMSFILTLANVGDTETLSRLLVLFENNAMCSQNIKRLYPKLKHLLIDLKYKEGLLHESMLLMASSPVKSSVRQLALKLNEAHIPVELENPKLYFIEILSLDEMMLIPISPVFLQKRVIL